MSKYQRQSSIQGKWVKGSEVKSGSQCRLVTETNPEESQFKNKDGSMRMQDVAKIQFKGAPEPLNISINRASINALVEAFGEDSTAWMNKTLTALTEKVVVAGKRVVALYLVPDGYELGEDAGGYVKIVKHGVNLAEGEAEYPGDDLDPNQIPW